MGSEVGLPVPVVGSLLPAEPCLVPANIVLLVGDWRADCSKGPEAGPWGSHMARVPGLTQTGEGGRRKAKARK